MKPVRDIEQLVRNHECKPHAETHQRILGNLRRAWNQKRSQIPGTTRSEKRRTIMHIPIIKIAAAAVIALGAVFTFTQFDNGTSVVWAEVAQKVENTCGVIFRTQEIRQIKQRDFETNTVTYLSLPPSVGMKQDRYQKGQLIITTWFQMEERQMVSVLHQMKKYGVDPIPGDMSKFMHQSGPQIIVRDLRSEVHKELGSQIIDGIKAEGIEIRHNDNTTKIWVAVDSQWPIRYEMQKDGESQPSMIMKDFQWNVQIDPCEFVPNIPKDYTLLELKKK